MQLAESLESSVKRVAVDRTLVHDLWRIVNEVAASIDRPENPLPISLSREREGGKKRRTRGLSPLAARGDAFRRQ